MIAILIIVVFSALITIGKIKDNRHVKPIWIPLTFVSFFGWGILSLGTKYAFSLGVNVYQRGIYLTLFVTMFIVLEITIRKIKLPKIPFRYLLLLLVLGILSGLFNLFMMIAIDKAPNLGYVNAINASSISAVTIACAGIYKDDLSLQKFIGVLGVTTGLILLII